MKSDIRTNPVVDSSGIARDDDGRSANDRSATVVDRSIDDDVAFLRPPDRNRAYNEPATTRQRIAPLGHCGDTEYDISEMFSALLVCTVAEQKGFRRGYSIDVAHTDKLTGKTWDLADSREQNRFWTLSRRRSSEFLVASLPSRTRSSLNKFTQ